ncbi:hypothetical protein IAD21_03037 [Abditibacteriota bacterium]|nr:hypothetical protein IAD21_03037 [Abditibacteriota bacterium]
MLVAANLVGAPLCSPTLNPKTTLHVYKSDILRTMKLSSVTDCTPLKTLKFMLKSGAKTPSARL